MSIKFESAVGPSGVEYRYGNLFRHDVHPDWSCVIFAPNEGQIPLMLDIAKQWNGPYGILYVLKVSRRGHENARYQCPGPCSFDDLMVFAHTFQDYFERDGRHHLWFADMPSGAQLVYDNHNLIYSYGNDDEVIALLKSKDFSEDDPRVPRPHMHHYNAEFDENEEQIMKYFQWIKSPLQDKHDDI